MSNAANKAGSLSAPTAKLPLRSLSGLRAGGSPASVNLLTIAVLLTAFGEPHRLSGD